MIEVSEHLFSHRAGIRCERIVRDGLPRVRKTATGSAAARLASQKSWLERHAHLVVAPKIVGFHSAPAFCILELEYYDKIISFFELCQTEGAEALGRFSRLIDYVNREILITCGVDPTTLDFDFYLKKKLSEKIQLACRSHPAIAALAAQPEIKINGVWHNGLDDSTTQLLRSRRLRNLVLAEKTCDIHGDLTFENVFCRGAEMLFLDPNPDNIISTAAVEFGKLAQSLHSHYEYIPRGRVVDFSNDSIEYEIPEAPAVYEDMMGLLYKTVDADLLHFHEAIHFARLLPYRVEADPERAVIHFAKCIELLDSLAISN